jgi:rSAM/selenodomain-associated transferase 1
MTRTLLVFAKAPRAGEAKTRLVRRAPANAVDVSRSGTSAIDAIGAALLAEAFLRDTLDDARRIAKRSSTEVRLCFTPSDARTELTLLAPGVELVEQTGTDLGARMSSAFAASFARGASRTIAIGTDTPQLGAEGIERAFTALASAGLVRGPSTDGGYHLIGLTSQHPELFEAIEWSTPRVLATTLARAKASKLRVELLAEHRDVDTPEDLAALERWLATAPPTACPHTRAVLIALGRGALDPRG